MATLRRLAAGAALVACAGAVAACEPAPPPSWTSELVSVSPDGTAAGTSDYPVFSPDGTKVAFRSNQGDFGPTDTNGWEDVYVRDLATGTTSLVSVNAAGTDSGDDASSSIPSFDASGTRVAFTSSASDLVEGDGNGSVDVFVRDLTTATTTLVSVNADGTGSGNGYSMSPVFSPDGTAVAFTSIATDLGPPDGNGYGDVYLRDLTAGQTTLVSADDTGAAVYQGGSGPVSFTPDGAGVVFVGSGPYGQIVQLRDLVSETTTLVSAAPDGSTGFGGSAAPVLSPDGTKVAFESTVADFGPTDTNGEWDVYVRDLVAGTTSLVSTDAGGGDSANGRSLRPVFSPDSSSIAFTSFGSDFGPTDTHPTLDVYVRDLESGVIDLVSANPAGTDSASADSGAWNSVEFDPGGTHLAFISSADDLGPVDTNTMPDVYVRDLVHGITSLVSANGAGTDSGDSDSGYGSDVSFSPDGGRILFESRATDLTDGIGGEARGNVFIATAPDAADLGVALDVAPGEVASGEEVAFVASVSNEGPDPADDAVVVLVVPEGVTVDGVSGGSGTCEPPTPAWPNVVVCDLGGLPDGTTTEVTVTATVAAPGGTELTALVVADAATYDPGGTPSTDTAVVVVVA